MPDPVSMANSRKISSMHSKLTTRFRKAMGSYFYFLYLPIGVLVEHVSVFFNSLGRPGQWLTLSEVKQHKKSDTLFILGSGGSINRLTEQHWADIAKGDSFGLNHWPLHPFTPTYYIFENSKPQSRPIYFTNFAKVWDRYSQTLMIYKDGARGKKRFDMVPEEFRSRFRILNNPTLPIRSINQIGLAMRVLRFLLKIANHERKMTVYRKRASLLTVVEFAVVAGYKEIVLCGVDLNTSDFFYGPDREKLLAEGYRVPNYVHQDGIHKTENPRHGEVTVSQLLKSFDEYVLKPAGIQMSVGSKTSALASWMPYYWENQEP